MASGSRTNIGVWLTIAAIVFLFGSEFKNSDVKFAVQTNNDNRITDLSLRRQPKKPSSTSIHLPVKTAVRAKPKVIYQKPEYKKSNSDNAYFEHVKRKYVHNTEPEFVIEKAPDGSLWEVRRKTIVHTHVHRVRRVDKPNHCECAPSKAAGNGWCWYYYLKDSNYCKKRPCRRKFVCVSHHTGLTCMKRVTKQKIVPVAHNSCRTVRMYGEIYVPYSTR